MYADNRLKSGFSMLWSMTSVGYILIKERIVRPQVDVIIDLILWILFTIFIVFVSRSAKLSHWWSGNGDMCKSIRSQMLECETIALKTLSGLQIGGIVGLGILL